MKPVNFITFFVLCVLCYSCNHNTEPDPARPLIDNLWGQVTIVKIPSSTDINYVIAYKQPDSENNSETYKIRGRGLCCQEFFLGTNPYIHLFDNYYLVDWKWGILRQDWKWGSQNTEDNSVMLYDKWENVTNRQFCWDLSAPIIDSLYSFQKGYITRWQIDDILGIVLPKDTIPYGMHEMYAMPKNYMRPWWITSNAFRGLDDDRKSPYYKYYGDNSMSLEEWPDTILYMVDTSLYNVYGRDSLLLYSKQDYINDIHIQDSLELVYAERLTQILKDSIMSKNIIFE